MKKFLLLLCGALILGGFTSCEQNEDIGDVLVQSVSLDKHTVALTEGETATLTATVAPSNATNLEVRWSSKDTAIATVDGDGKVTAIAAGTVNIVVISVENPTIKDECAVTVAAEVISVEQITLDAEEIELTVGDTQTLTATVLPENATNKAYTWASSNSEIATVDDQGVVTAVADGSVVISAISEQDVDIKAECNVTVIENTIAIETINILKSYLLVDQGDSVQLTCILTPENASTKQLKWKSDDPDYVKITEDGWVFGLKECRGINVTAYSAADESIFDQCAVSVLPTDVAVTAVELSETELVMQPGKAIGLLYSIQPSNASNQSVKWTSSDPAVASVDSYGSVDAIVEGVATITCTSQENSEIFAECKVTVSMGQTTMALENISLTNYPTGNEWNINSSSAPTSDELASLKETLEALYEEDNYEKYTLVFPDMVTVPDQFLGTFSTITPTAQQNVASVEMPLAETVGELAFYNCTALSTVYLPKVVTVGDFAFVESTIEDISLPQTTSIGRQAFFNCVNMTSVELPLLESVSDSCFFFNSSLMNVNLPKVTSIGDGAFYWCEALETATFDEATSMGDNVFQLCTNLQTVTAEKVTAIGNEVFKDCSNLTEAIMPKLAVAGTGVFEQCMKLLFANYPELIALQNRFFYYCEGLIDVDLSSVETVGEDVIYSCNALNRLILPKATLISDFAFSYNQGIEGIELPEATQVGKAAFSDCLSLKYVDLPKLETAGDELFFNCNSLATLEIATESFITDFGVDAFYTFGDEFIGNITLITGEINGTGVKNEDGVIMWIVPCDGETITYSGFLDILLQQ